MPVYSHPDGAKIFYVHVPKTGGTYIEMLLRANGFEQELWNGRPHLFGLKISPQHLHAAIYDQFIDLEAFNVQLMTVRHPVDRLVSEYRSRIAKHGKNFREWLAWISQELEIESSTLDNHLRPQVEFYRPGLEVHRMEDGFTKVWAIRLAERAGVNFTQLEAKRRRDTRNTNPVELSRSDIDLASEFCLRHYSEDFDFFDYKVDCAEEIQKLDVDSLR